MKGNFQEGVVLSFDPLGQYGFLRREDRSRPNSRDLFFHLSERREFIVRDGDIVFGTLPKTKRIPHRRILILYTEMRGPKGPFARWGFQDEYDRLVATLPPRAKSARDRAVESAHRIFNNPDSDELYLYAVRMKMTQPEVVDLLEIEYELEDAFNALGATGDAQRHWMLQNGFVDAKLIERILNSRYIFPDHDYRVAVWLGYQNHLQPTTVERLSKLLMNPPENPVKRTSGL